MEWLFVNPSLLDQPQRGQILVQHRPPQPNEWRNAEAALDVGPDAFLCGEPPWTTIVVRNYPSLDDMLAASILEKRISGQEIPAGMRNFVKYAAVCRKGLYPGKLPFTESLDALYLALRNGTFESKTKFVDNWRRLENAIWHAACNNVDPFQTTLFGSDEIFAEEQAYLARDHDVYRLDVQRGNSWTASIPGGPPQAAVLYLRKPKSVLYKYWSRDDSQAPGGGGYLLLVVEPSPGYWTIATDPVQRISLKSLADRLQQRELQKSPTASRDPWFDGARFSHTLIASPNNCSQLPREVVLREIRQWSRANNPHSSQRQFAALAMAAGMVALLLLGAATSPIWLKSKTNSEVANNNVHRPVSRAGMDVFPDSTTAPRIDERAKRQGRDIALLFATQDYDDPYWNNDKVHLSNPIGDATAVADVLKSQYGFETMLVKNPTTDELLDQLQKLHAQQYSEDDQLLIYIAGHGELASSIGYVVTKDARSPHDDHVYKTYVSTSNVRTLLTTLECRHVLVVLDICFGGSIEFGHSFTMRGKEKSVSRDQRDKYIVKKLRSKSCLCITPGDGPTSDGEPGKHSPFCQSLIDILDSPDDDGILTFSDVVDGLQKRVDPKYGQLRANEEPGDFLFIAPYEATK